MERLSFKAAADAPMRVSVQVRDPRSGARWQRSVVWIDPRHRICSSTFADMAAVDEAPVPIPSGDIDSVLFVVDTTNTPHWTTRDAVD